jgi:hypothetical protein
MDPRVKITPEVQQIFTLTTQMEENAHVAMAAYKDARALLDKLQARPQSAANDSLVKELEAFAPPEPVAPAGGGRGRGGRGGGGEPAAPPNLSNIASLMVAAAQGMQAAEMAPTAAELEACSREQASYSTVMAKWSALRAKASGPAPAGGRGAAK